MTSVLMIFLSLMMILLVFATVASAGVISTEAVHSVDRLSLGSIFADAISIGVVFTDDHDDLVITMSSLFSFGQIFLSD